ncbi:TetR/AcrR family transcriptional regulator [Streptomyces mangrovisoli]|uniref:TetR family transcriptional regulator n=1 Tax=Streptomyces mangrovisoli TaxID=1428628 RepID=A0A1J4P2V9_9ACTN|nr:TetR/AcrR family transcriptional regulator [Streptomyces mangrovisoli]OIJ68084.1 TetR family transcriptional regulator [Streptomyces mangrovisoli]
MTTRTRRTERRQEPLSRERIVGAAVDLLDTVGESGLTFRALAERLETGPGAIYWHVTGKAELLAAATEAVVVPAVAADDTDRTPQEAIRTLALGVFDAFDAHPWVGAQFSRATWRPTLLRVFERIGRQVQALGVPEPAQFTAASALMNYIVGVAGQNAATTRAVAPGTNRADFLDATAHAWSALDPGEFAFARGVAGRLREHDDRTEFAAGVDLIVAGITGGT